MSRTTNRQSRKSKFKIKDREYRQEEKRRRNLNREKKQVRAVLDFMVNPYC